MLKTLCVVAAAAFHSLPPHLRPAPCDSGGSISVLADNSVEFRGVVPADWRVVIDQRRRVVLATFNGREVRQ